MILVDTNILTRLTHKGHPHRPIARKAVGQLHQRGEQLAVVPQNLYEFWAVATRPAAAAGGLGMTPERAEQWVAYFLRVFAFLPDNPNVFPAWRKLVLAHRVRGRPTHDARLVAAMGVHGVEGILTFNGDDFKRYGVRVVDPVGV